MLWNSRSGSNSRKALNRGPDEPPSNLVIMMPMYSKASFSTLEDGDEGVGGLEAYEQLQSVHVDVVGLLRGGEGTGRLAELT